MVVEEALATIDRLPDNEKHEYFSKILFNSHFVSLGAVGPDYPYLYEVIKEIIKVKHHSWADRMHYENIDRFVVNGIQNLQKLPESDLPQSDFNICLSWFCGFVTHLIVDTVIHPVVNAIVGPYIFNSDEHRHCEMTQDSFIFMKTKKCEIYYSAPGDDGYLGILKMCHDPDDKDHLHPAVRNFWTSTLKMSHPGGVNHFDTIVPDEWHRSFISTIGSSSKPPYLFRHMEEDLHISYEETSDILAEDRRRFIDEIALPGDNVGKFKENAFDNAVAKVIYTWTHLFGDIKNNKSGNSLPYIKNWNLDLGVDMDNCTFWNEG